MTEVSLIFSARINFSARLNSIYMYYITLAICLSNCFNMHNSHKIDDLSSFVLVLCKSELRDKNDSLSSEKKVMCQSCNNIHSCK